MQRMCQTSELLGLTVFSFQFKNRFEINKQAHELLKEKKRESKYWFLMQLQVNKLKRG